MQRVPIFLIVVLFLVGAVALTIGVLTGWSSWNALVGAERVDGTVVELVRVASAKAAGPKNKGGAISKGPAFAPLVEYQVGAQSYRIRGHVASSPPAYGVGDRVSILVHPERANEGRIDSFSEWWLGSIVFGGGGLLFVAIAIVLLFVRRRGDGPA
jgi:hypothetical protein